MDSQRKIVLEGIRLVLEILEYGDNITGNDLRKWLDNAPPCVCMSVIRKAVDEFLPDKGNVDDVYDAILNEIEEIDRREE